MTGATDPERLRRSDVYVFCLLEHLDKPTLDPLDLSQWAFHVLPTRVLDVAARTAVRRSSKPVRTAPRASRAASPMVRWPPLCSTVASGPGFPGAA
ncbi:hypothetical protein [Streptomyces virginiae]|uniref:hypothetical protein n=1 Tax=Streptomyces virginiae TaxID=1961 RepID=UPI002DB87F86|nr:hypothetical protein [Streptomyces sp. CMAA1738]MEC4572858.1 hypothetical protein [Streptomyces sp. CMAA1738]